MKRILVIMLLVMTIIGCAPSTAPASAPAPKPPKKPIKQHVIINPESKIPADQKKITPDTDLLPPILHSDEYKQPVSVPYPVSTAGAEDSGFVMPDGNTLYFWFTPNPRAPLGQQIDEGVTGIYVSRKAGGKWQKPERIFLQDPDKQSLDGCAFVQDDTMWFCTARTGYTGMHWAVAKYINGKWADWKVDDFNPDYKVRELHITADGKELYFHSDRPGGKGQNDIWVSRRENGKWLPPQNVEIVNSSQSDSLPFLTEDGGELWFTRWYKGSPAIFRSKKVNGKWQEPELIISQFAAESSVDNDGNVYFAHHFYKDGVMLEADIYVAYKK